MCELLGLSFNNEVDIQISLSEFQERGKRNRDGWGLASYNSERKAEIVKEATSSYMSSKYETILKDKNRRSNIFIGHVRYTTHGVKALRNTHPFQRHLNGRDYVFAHNGSLKNFKTNLRLRNFIIPEGETDSEWAFCYILEHIKIEKLDFRQPSSFLRLQEILRSINQIGTFNCLLSDGEHLFAYFDRENHNGLYFCLREAPFHRIRLKDKDWELDLSNLKDILDYGYLIATSPLSDEKWLKMQAAEMIAFRQGKIIWPEERKNAFKLNNKL